MSTKLAALVESGRLRRVDAALGEWIARTFPDPGDAPLAAALTARAVADGHSALALDAAQAWFNGIEGEGKPPPLPDVSTWRESLPSATAVQVHGDAVSDLRPLVLDAQGRIYLRRYFEYERQLATALMARMHAIAAKLPTLESSPGDTGPEQLRAIHVAQAHRFTLVTGGPGTGKTHGVVRMLAALASDANARGANLRITLAAPTGKAAARLAESVRVQLGTMGGAAATIPHDARTLHALLGLSPWRNGPLYNRATPLPFDVIVVDEVSMVDLPLMAKLVDATAPDARLILLGDPDQLSAVEAGNVLGALVEAARSGPLADCHVALTHSHRFEADSGLAELARAIACGDADAALVACESASDIALVDTAHTTQFIDAAAAAFHPLLDARDPAGALAAARDFRVLTALRHGPEGCIATDRAIAARLQRAVGVRADERWWRGRLILVTANRPGLQLFNGDTGVIWPDADGEPKAWFEGLDGGSRAFPIAALPPCEGAFALTVHKAQGSEFGHVALVTGRDSAVLTRELLYTGVTRARRGLALHTDCDTLRTGIARRSLRMSGLADRLREAACAPNLIA
ncbi:MAG TPA: exodeoxyribonuclease V subunit alpha [Rhodanobacteraceae bacterium]